MIIPIRCWTCGKVTGDLYEGYLRLVAKYKGKKDTGDTIINLKNVQKTPEGKAMDDLGLDKICCRRIMLSHKDING